MASWKELIPETQHLSDRGNYDAAVAKLRDFLVTAQGADRLHATAELTTVLRDQGYWKDAFDTLEQEIEIASRTCTCDDPLYLQLRMQACRLRPVVLASFKGVLENAAEIFEIFSSLDGIDDLHPSRIRINSAYSSLRFMASDFHHRRPGQELRSAVNWQLPAFQRLMSAKREREALDVAIHYSRLLNITSVKQYRLEDLCFGSLNEMMDAITVSEAAPLLKAAAISELLQHMYDKCDGDRINELETTAIRLFEEEAHSHGAMDVRIRQASRQIKNNFQYLTPAVMEEIRGYFNVYESVNALSAYGTAIQLISGSIPAWMMFDLRLSFTSIAAELSDKTGARFEYLIAQVRLLTNWLVHSAKSSRVIEATHSLDALLEVEDCRWIKGMIANITSQAYGLLGDWKNAHEWAAKAETTWGDYFQEDRAHATLTVLQAKIQKHGGYASLTPPAMKEVMDFAELEVTKHLKDGLFGSASQKMAVIVGEILIPRNDGRRNAWLDRMDECAQSLSATSPDDADTQRARVYSFRGQALLGATADKELEEKRYEYFERATALYMKVKDLLNAACTRHMQALAVYSTFKAQERPSWNSLQRCIELSGIARDAFGTLGNVLMLAEAARMHAFYNFLAWSHGYVDGTTALLALKDADEASAERRDDVSILASFEAVSRKQQFISTSQIQDTYKRALAICKAEGRLTDLWDWIQRAKARSVSDQIGIEAAIPAALRDDIIQDSEAKSLSEQENAVSQQIAQVDPQVRLRLRGTLHQIQARMNEHPLLKPILDLRKSRQVSIDQMRDLGRQIKYRTSIKDVVFVDWVELLGTIWIVALKGDEAPRIVSCQIEADKIAAWKRQWLEAKPGAAPALEDEEYDEDEPEFCLRSIDCLVAPLRDFTSEGDLLVFCPTGVLHSIPLHALWITDQKTAIERNPVIYSASLTTFWQCYRRSELTSSTDFSWNIVGVFEPAPGRQFSPAERTKVYESLTHLAKPPGNNVNTGKAVTSEAFRNKIERSVIFHFHGHCLFDRAVLTDQSLELADGLLPIRSVFEMKLQSPHITLIACDSASQAISAGDEPLGMVTALLCAGAGSVLGTLWPTASRTGRRFSDEFYSDIANQCRAAGQPVMVNLAEALRRTVLALRRRRDTRQPFHWAAFVLHGSCSIALTTIPGSHVGGQESKPS
ncbi:hypothetical protein CONLIGDRAFT_699404 [Coniochaeta ligniaria NRRL 30616]|uniref:CHAT domain-containing protein n=1 Tax=Coniochaeta ligniaria NRRL 30616 TaxID=1408157 RepID=A0A1J7IZ72_9PEZI|nr:hypothetical protein CONLIGDRAFT_699404 [Coniochaeta ligniaria NRRL 30616]